MPSGPCLLAQSSLRPRPAPSRCALSRAGHLLILMLYLAEPWFPSRQDFSSAQQTINLSRLTWQAKSGLMQVPHRRVGSCGRAPGGAGWVPALGVVDSRTPAHRTCPRHGVQVRHLQQREKAPFLVSQQPRVCSRQRDEAVNQVCVVES